MPQNKYGLLLRWNARKPDSFAYHCFVETSSRKRKGDLFFDSERVHELVAQGRLKKREKLGEVEVKPLPTTRFVSWISFSPFGNKSDLLKKHALGTSILHEVMQRVKFFFPKHVVLDIGATGEKRAMLEKIGIAEGMTVEEHCEKLEDYSRRKNEKK